MREKGSGQDLEGVRGFGGSSVHRSIGSRKAPYWLVSIVFNPDPWPTELLAPRRGNLGRGGAHTPS